MKSKTLIETQIQKKTNSELVKTIILAKKKKEWLKIAGILSGPRKNRSNLNLEEIEKKAKSKTVLIPGKVLSQGEINKKLKIIALNFSEKAKEKLLKAGCELLTIEEEIKKNPQAKELEILKSKSRKINSNKLNRQRNFKK